LNLETYFNVGLPSACGGGGGRLEDSKKEREREKGIIIGTGSDTEKEMRTEGKKEVLWKMVMMFGNGGRIILRSVA
jgi:hypothetical protein